MAKKRVSPFFRLRPHGTASHYSLGVKWDRNSMGPLVAFVDNLTACGPILHLAIVGVGRKKSHFMDNLAALMDNFTADRRPQTGRSFF